MNWTVEKLETEPFARVALKGVFDSDDHLRMLEDLISRRFWKPSTSVLMDFRGVEFTDTNIEDVKEASANRRRNDGRLGDSKTAFLAKSLTDFARGRQFQLFTEDKVSGILRIFLDEKQALDWLEDKTSAE